jgi:hypothetical protein
MGTDSKPVAKKQKTTAMATSATSVQTSVEHH